MDSNQNDINSDNCTKIGTLGYSDIHFSYGDLKQGWLETNDSAYKQ